ncbi:hypothetical protein GCM10009416_13350 [Craurococcus roseus]|uniref:Peptidase M15A C-terminal domain-containing protein n=1 Tax=Craurococcus roseus TaxID=77585 RepID=A0ABP3PUB9_9PROT
MTEEQLDRPCGRHLTFRDLVEAGETWRRVRVANLPAQADTVAALRRLAEEILDPVIARFGPLEVTYGFASPALARHVPGRIDPARDQHAGHELKPDGSPVCARLGQAADFRVGAVCSGRIAAWIAGRLPFDRLYFYGADRPLHVSVGPAEARAVVTMLPGPSGRRVPRTRPAGWLLERFGAP